MIIEFLLLACSYKHGGRCVAGIDLTNKRLARLVTEEDDETGAIPKEECNFLSQMNVYQINVLRHGKRSGAQKENYVVGNKFLLKYVRRASFGELRDYMTYHVLPFNSSAPYLTYSEYYSYAFGKGSLMLYTAYSIRGFATNGLDNKPKEKVSFDLLINNKMVTLVDYSCTCPGEKYYNKDFLENKAVILISIPPEVTNGGKDRYYKFVSAIIPNTL